MSLLLDLVCGSGDDERRRRWGLLVAMTLWLIGGCGRLGYDPLEAGADAAGCTVNADCVEVCLGNVCGPLANTNQFCDESADCQPAHICANSLCTATAVGIVDSFESWPAGTDSMSPPEGWTIDLGESETTTALTSESLSAISADDRPQPWFWGGPLTDGNYGVDISVSSGGCISNCPSNVGDAYIAIRKDFDLTGLNWLYLDLAGLWCPCNGMLPSIAINVGADEVAPAFAVPTLESAPYEIVADISEYTGVQPVEIVVTIPFTMSEAFGIISIDNLRLVP